MMASVFVILAMEFCTGSAHFDECVDWMTTCQIARMVRAERWTVDDGAEHCAENMPERLTEGM